MSFFATEEAMLRRADMVRHRIGSSYGNWSFYELIDEKAVCINKYVCNRIGSTIHSRDRNRMFDKAVDDDKDVLNQKW